jgi:diguanylate cyclase (GGDEF)-like protein
MEWARRRGSSKAPIATLHFVPGCALDETDCMDRERILIQVKNRRDRHLLEDWLSPSYEIITAHADDLLEERFDLAVVDGPSLKRFHSKIRARRKAEEPVLLPFLLLTFSRANSTPTRHLGKLVDDLIVRPIDENELRARVANLLRLHRLSVELKKEHDRVLKLSVTDDVSGFNNTRYLHRYLDRFLSTPDVHEVELSLVFFDLDNFKRVVDTHGHLLGSKVLKEVAQAVHHELDDDDRIVRYGGDEFVVILPRQGKAQALTKVRRMKRAITATPFLQKEKIDVHVTASFGLATFPHDAGDKRGLLAAADDCLFRSKADGKNRISVAGPPRRNAAEESAWVLAE